MSDDPRARLCEIARGFYEREWMVGTSGNLSAKDRDNEVWITASGRSKGELMVDDFVRDSDDEASAETTIHQAIYRLFPDVRAVFHVHSVQANLVAAMQKGGVFAPLPALEMLKGLGIWKEYPTVSIPIFSNHFEVAQIAREVEETLSKDPPAVPGFLIRDHGLTAWGPSLEAARSHVELFDYLFRYIVESRRLPLD